MRTFTIIILLLALPRAGRADSGQPDTIVSRPRGPVARLVDYLSTTNRPDTTRRFDLSLIGGPYYSSENKLGMGLVAAGLYHGHPHDTLTSQVNLYVDVSVTGYYKLGVDGIHYVGAAGHRLVYEASFESMPDRYWGMGYAAGSNDDTETKYKKCHAQLDGALLLRLPVAHLYVGPHVMADYLAARHIANATLWGGQRLHTFTASVGMKAEYDTRDSRYNAHRGLYAALDQLFAPRFLGNHYAFASTELRCNGYVGVWKGGTLAGSLHTRLTYGDTPWGLMAKVGGSYTLRGYWEGRYNDKCAADATVELRQRVYGRHGAVAWAGVGEVFAHPRNLFAGHALPNAGLGYRWEFKKDVNIRLDCGFGRHGYGIIFNLNEAF